MTEPDEYTYPRYLHAKKTVDDRALNRRVWGCFLDQLTAGSPEEVRILEVGGGVGATVERVVDAIGHRSVTHLDYTFVDLNPENVHAGREALTRWAKTQGFEVRGDQQQHWVGNDLGVSIQYLAEDLFDHAATDTGTFNAVIAQAVLDILDTRKTMKALKAQLTSPGLLYLPIHFDGLTSFEPSLPLDGKIEELYHESMTSASGQGRDGAKCGRHLLTHFKKTEALFEVGSSDWIVHPTHEGYPADEAYFLHHILHFIEEELTDHPELERTRLKKWLQTRRRQIDDEELIYIAHQLDVLAQTNQPG